MTEKEMEKKKNPNKTMGILHQIIHFQDLIRNYLELGTKQSSGREISHLELFLVLYTYRWTKKEAEEIL